MGRKIDALTKVVATLAGDDRTVARASKDGAKRVEGKYGKLRRSPYKLFRATNPMFIGDLESLPEYWRTPAHEISGPLLGDAHPENLGAIGASAAEAQMDCTDFDVVAFGPLARDLARAACGFAIAQDQVLPKDKADDKGLAHALDDCPSEKSIQRARLLVTTYVENLLAGAGGLPDAAAFAQHLAAADAGAEKAILDESTHVVTEHPGSAGILDALGSYTASTPAVAGARLVKAWLLYGKGASSFSVNRIILRLALPGGARDRVVEWKPQPDAPTVLQAYRQRRNPATLDPFLGVASVAGVGHVAQEWLVDPQKVKSKDLQGPYADSVARLFAVRFADLHRRFQPAIIERVRGQPIATIADAIADVVTAYIPLLASEWRAFLDVSSSELCKRVAG